MLLLILRVLGTVDKQWLYIPRGISGSAIRHTKYEIMAKNSAELVMLPLYSGYNRLYRGMYGPPLFQRANCKDNLIKIIHIFRCNLILHDNNLYAVEPLPDDLWVFTLGTLLYGGYYKHVLLEQHYRIFPPSKPEPRCAGKSLQMPGIQRCSSESGKQHEQVNHPNLFCVTGRLNLR